MSVRILTGDCRELLRTMPDESVHCVVTSPPYWGLRDYGVDGQLGMERSLGEHVETMTDVFREVRRVLRSDGTLWLNYGDSYATSVNGRSAADTKAAGNDDRTFRDKPFSTIGPISRVGQSGNKGNSGADHGFRVPGFRPGSGRADGKVDSRGQRNRNGLTGFDAGILKPKDLCGIPWRVAFALQADGWWLRQDIIWSKPNPMPESVRDRCTKAHEYLFLLSKNERYYFDQDAISEELADSSIDRLSQPTIALQGGSNRVPGKTNGPMKAVGSLHMQETPRNDGDRWRLADGGVAPRGKRNKRSVWEVTTQPFPEAHFATFPPALIEPCILAGCPSKCCAKCGAPWVREIERTRTFESGSGRAGNMPVGKNGANLQGGGETLDIRRGPCISTTTLGFSPFCACNADTVPGTCLDPFSGAGTTGLVADRLQRNAILIELNPDYVAMASERLRGDAPLFYEAAE